MAHSDIDLRVLESAPGDTRQESIRIRQAVRGLGDPFDIIVMAVQRFEQSKKVAGRALPILPTRTARSSVKQARDRVWNEFAPRRLPQAEQDLREVKSLRTYGTTLQSAAGFHSQQTAA